MSIPDYKSFSDIFPNLNRQRVSDWCLSCSIINDDS